MCRTAECDAFHGPESYRGRGRRLGVEGRDLDGGGRGTRDGDERREMGEGGVLQTVG
jgi:hypothetical protein